jgi:hypothetical protein
MALKVASFGIHVCAGGALALIFYLTLNLALTLLNKQLLQKVCATPMTCADDI